MKNTKLVLYDGKKSMDVWDSDRGWTIISGDDDKTGLDLLVRSIPWLYRAVKLRSNSVPHVPYAIVKGKTDLDISSDWQNKVKFMPDPSKLLRQFTRSLIIAGSAYAEKGINAAGLATRLQYLSPKTISAIVTPSDGLVGFERHDGTRTIKYSANELLSIYDPDYATEAGPTPNQSDAIAALQSAGVLYNLDVFVSRYFDRGAIRASVLSVTGGSKEESERLKNWWGDVVGGIKNAWSSFVLRADSVKPTILGDGIDGLQDNELTTAKRQDIATALGIPESKLWSSAANYATSEQDNRAYYEETVIPDCELIQGALNDQVFKPMGMKFEFRPESLSQFQKEEVDRASAYAQYIAAGMRPSLAAQVVGIDLPSGVDYTALDPVAEPEPVIENNNNVLMAGEDVAPAQRSMLENWKKKSLHALKNGLSANCEFHTDLFSDEQIEDIRSKLEKVSTNEEVKQIFADAKLLIHDPNEELRRANDLLERALA